MVIDYIKSIIFIIIFLIYLDILGNALCKKESGYAKKVIIAYIVHSCLIGIIGVIVQILNIPWNIFMYSQVIIILILLMTSIYLLKRQNRLIANFSELFLMIRKHFKNNWFIYFVTSMMLVFSLANVELQLLNNHLDDGLYLLKISQLPYLKNPYETVYATGFSFSRLSNLATFSYMFNVFDLEASVYNYILGTSTTIFVRFALNWINYYIFVMSFYWFIDVIIRKKNITKEANIQYLTSPILILCFYPEWLNNLYSVPDDWQINSAMWYGSSIVRCTGIFVMFIPLIEGKIEKRSFIYWLITSITLFTKSSIAVPLIIFGLYIYIIDYLYCNKRNLVKYLILLYILLVFGVMYLIGIPSNSWNNLRELPLSIEGIRNISNHMIFLVVSNKNSIMLFITIIAIILSFIKQTNTYILKWNKILLLMAALTIIPVLNYPFITCSIYTHVARRMFTLLIYTVMLTGFTYIFVFVYHNIKKGFYHYSISFIVILSILSSFVINYKQIYDMKSTCEILNGNRYLIPQTTIELSNKIEEISKELEQELHVLAPDVVYVYNMLHPLSTMLRINAIDAKIISAIPRFGYSNDKTYKDFDEEQLIKYRNFALGLENNVQDIEKIIDNYNDINCLVSTVDIAQTLSNKNNFKLMGHINGIIDYYIYVKE